MIQKSMEDILVKVETESLESNKFIGLDLLCLFIRIAVYGQNDGRRPKQKHQFENRELNFARVS